MQGKCLTPPPPASSTRQKWKQPTRTTPSFTSVSQNYLSSLDIKSTSSHSGTQNTSTAQNYPGPFGSSSRRRRNPSSHGLSPGKHARTTMEPNVTTYASPRSYQQRQSKTAKQKIRIDIQVPPPEQVQSRKFLQWYYVFLARPQYPSHASLYDRPNFPFASALTG